MSGVSSRKFCKVRPLRSPDRFCDANFRSLVIYPTPTVSGVAVMTFVWGKGTLPKG